MADERKHGEPRQFDRMEDLARGLAEEGPDARPDEGGARDVTGWDVLAADGTRIGAVERVLRDREGGTARYLDVEIAGHLSAGNAGRHVLIPLGETRPADEGDKLVVQRLRGEDVNNLPPYVREEVPPDYDVQFRDRIGNRFGVAPEPEQGFLGQQADADPDASR